MVSVRYSFKNKFLTLAFTYVNTTYVSFIAASINYVKHDKQFTTVRFFYCEEKALGKIWIHGKTEVPLKYVYIPRYIVHMKILWCFLSILGFNNFCVMSAHNVMYAKVNLKVFVEIRLFFFLFQFLKRMVRIQASFSGFFYDSVLRIVSNRSI